MIGTGTGTQSHGTVGTGTKICGTVPLLKSRGTTNPGILGQGTGTEVCGTTGTGLIFAGLTSGTETKNRWTVPYRSLPIPAVELVMKKNYQQIDNNKFEKIVSYYSDRKVS